MPKFSLKVVPLPVILAAMAVPLHAANPAFPGAEGPGAIATGGRGGDVYHVTTLDPDKTGVIPGSFQYGINFAPAEGRTIVFDVGGTIYLNGLSANDTLRYGKANITVAGQTAPGPGITIAGTGTKWTGTNNIIRNLTVRPNINSKNITFDAFSLQVKNSMVDHVTATWFTDEGISETDAGESSTIQYAYINEGLNNAGHSYGSIIATEVDGTSLSYHHNLYAHNASRMPRLGSENKIVGAYLNFSNNVIYNWSGNAGYSALDVNTGVQQPSSTNFINNYYVKGSNPGSTIFSSAGDKTSLYVNGNVYDSNKNGVLDASAITQTAFTGTKTLSNTPFTVSGVNTADSATLGMNRTLDYGGANWQSRNPIDTRIAASVRDGTGAIINDLTDATHSAEWNTMLDQRTAVSRAANYDTDRDGMPDVWEAAHGINPAVANNNADFDSDGYTDLEEYINEAGAWPAPNTLTFNNANANGRYAEINNWGNLWQPSRYDNAQITGGTVAVDAVGQHARNLAVAPASGNTAGLRVSGGWIDVAESLTVGAGGTGSVTQTAGYVRADKSVVLGSSTAAGSYTMSGGTLSTPLLTAGGAGTPFFVFTGGTLHADLITFRMEIHGGTLAPGGDTASQLLALAAMPDINGELPAVPGLIGTTRVQGNLLIGAGVVQIQLADALTFDRLVIDGLLTLGGSLDLQLLNNYSPVVGDRWLIATAAGISGNFATVTPGFAVEKSSGSLYVVAVPEPATLTAFGLGGLILRRRRR